MRADIPKSHEKAIIGLIRDCFNIAYHPDEILSVYYIRQR